MKNVFFCVSISTLLFFSCKDREKTEVEVLFLPGTGKFSKQAACKLLVVSGDSPAPERLAREAHVIVADHCYPGADERYQFHLDEFDRALRAVA